MTPRSYHQHEPLARALDLLGERWTLLLLRDLLDGPRRYGELLEGLPGIGTNLLAARLKTLRSENLVERMESADGVQRYALSESGRALEDSLAALARFGLTRLGARAPGELWRADWLPLALRAGFRPELADGVEEEYELRVDEFVGHACVCGPSVRTGAGPAAYPSLVLVMDGTRWLDWLEGRVNSRELLSLPGVRLQGAFTTLERFRRIFGLPRCESELLPT